MAKKQSQMAASLAVELTPGFPVPLTIEEFKRDVVVLFIQQMRTMAWMTGGAINYHSALWQMIDRKPENVADIYSPDLNVDDLGVTWDDISKTDFAKYLYSMYEFGCLGIMDTSLEMMEDQSAYTWLSAILFDMKNSAFLNEWSEGYSGEGARSAQRCYEIAELANARRALETGQPFSYVLSAHGVHEQGIEDGQLTVRQLALLAGMEEMSIRAAANPGRANPLPTIEAERQEKRTRFAVDVAKNWLRSKGRYVPITRQHKGGDFDLKSYQFQSSAEIEYVMTARMSIALSGTAGTTLHDKALALCDHDGSVGLIRRALSDPDFMSELATTLQFPTDLFALRVRETTAREELARVERQLRDATRLKS